MMRLARTVLDVGFTAILVIAISLAALLIFAIQLVCMPFVFVSKELGKFVP